MNPKPISDRTVRRYMKAIIARSAAVNARIVSLEAPTFDSLRADPDFRFNIRKLEALGYIDVLWVDTYNPVSAALTDAGLAFLESKRDARSEQRWTRGLALASIILSVCALFVSGLSLYLQYR